MKHMYKIVLFVIMAICISYSQGENLPTSLHGTRMGKSSFYIGTETEPGFYSLTNVHIDSLGCKMCHPGSMMYQNGEMFTTETYDPLNCHNCHKSDFSVDQPDACKTCHGRINKQEMLGMTDVHVTEYNFTCTSCHSLEDIHGDGNTYEHMFDEYADDSGTTDYPIDADCENCHTGTMAPPSNPEHDQHMNDIHCSTCHTAQVITCYNCHFNQMVDEHQKVAHTALKGFMIIAHRTGSKYNGKIWPVSFQSLYYQTPEGHDTTFVTYVPYFSHNVVPKEEAKICSDCHNNANVQEYNTNGEIYIGKWSDTEGKVVGVQGVVPMPEDYKTSLKLEFVVQDTATGVWSPVGETTPDLVQNIGILSPLTQAEMQALSVPQDIPEPQHTIRRFDLKQNYPNPFNPVTTIEFYVPQTQKISLIVYNVAGQVVSKILDHKLVKAGTHRVKFNAMELNSGVYFYRLSGKNVTLTRKMVLVK